MPANTIECYLPECSTPVKHKGLCKKHYTRQWKYGGIYDDKELANEAATRLRKEVFGEFAGIA